MIAGRLVLSLALAALVSNCLGAQNAECGNRLRDQKGARRSHVSVAEAPDRGRSHSRTD